MILFALVFSATFPVCDLAMSGINKRIADSEASVSESRFVDYPSPQWVRNERFWLKDVDFSCVSPWNSANKTGMAGTLISKRHIIFAKHYPLPINTEILFVDQKGEVCKRRIVKTKASAGSDIMIGLLESEVASGVHPAKILSENFKDYIGTGWRLPVVTFNRKEQAFLTQIQTICQDGMAGCPLLTMESTNQSWKAFGEKLVPGDSGDPAFLLIGNEAILLYCIYSGGKGSGPSVFHYRKEVQSLMDELCPGYKLERFDFGRIVQSTVPVASRPR